MSTYRVNTIWIILQIYNFLLFFFQKLKIGMRLHSSKKPPGKTGRSVCEKTDYFLNSLNSAVTSF